MLTQLVSSNSAPAVLFNAVADDARPVSRLPPPPDRVQPAVDPRIERHAGPASATQHAALPADTLRAAGLSAAVAFHGDSACTAAFCPRH